MTTNKLNETKEKNLRELTEIDRRESGVSKRLEHVKEILSRNPEQLDNYNSIVTKEGDADSNYAEYLEQIGTYIINSSDVDSCRNGDYSFYENERRYRQYAIGKATFSIDVSDSGNTLSEVYMEDKYFEEDEQIKIDLSIYDNKQIKRLIRMGISEKDVSSSKLRVYMSKLYNSVLKKIDEDCIDILELMIDNKNDREISEALQIPRRTVNYRGNKIVDCIKKIACEADAIE